MAIKIPRYRLKSEFDLPSFRHRMQGPIGGRKLAADLNLTSLIDVFSAIILFLVTTFSATGEIIVAQKDLQLPKAKHARLLQRSPIVTITEKGVALEGADMGSNANISERIEESDWEMPRLISKLRQYRQTFENAQPGIPFPGNVIIQADRGLDFVYIKRVLYALVGEGYTGINLVVRGESTLPSSQAR